VIRREYISFCSTTVLLITMKFLVLLATVAIASGNTVAMATSNTTRRSWEQVQNSGLLS
jgi:hypothetical protein